MSQKPTPKWILTKIITIVFFWAITIAVLLYASGVRINWQSGHISSSISIYLKAQDKNKYSVKYSINGIERDGELPLILNQLQPGHYTIILDKEGAVSWQRSVYLIAGQAGLFQDIVFIPHSIKQREPTTSEKKLVSNKVELIDDGLVVRNNELYRTDGLTDSLIVRLSENIDQAFWFPKKTHVLVKTGTTVSILEVDGGANRTKLFTLADANAIKLAMPDEQTIVLEQNKTVTVYDISVP